MSVCVCVFMCMCVFACLCVCVFACICVCACLRVVVVQGNALGLVVNQDYCDNKRYLGCGDCWQPAGCHVVGVCVRVCVCVCLCVLILRFY